MSTLYNDNGVYKVNLIVDNDLNRLHDVMIELDGISRTDEELLDIFNSLSESTKFIAYQWSVGDTEFGDAVYTELKDKLDKVNDFLRRHTKAIDNSGE